MISNQYACLGRRAQLLREVRRFEKSFGSDLMGQSAEKMKARWADSDIHSRANLSTRKQSGPLLAQEDDTTYGGNLSEPEEIAAES